MTITQQARRLGKLKARAVKTKDAAETAEREFKEAERALFERMDTEGVGSIKVDGTNFVPTHTVYGQIQDREAFIEWALENEPELVEHHERKGLINELAKDYVERGEEFPPGLGFYVREYVSQRVAS